ncbi:PilZ domain-containing protein [Roseomonas sp. GCM10028921]
MLKVLRWQLGQVLAKTPVEGDALQAIALRARLAALFNAEFDKAEGRIGPTGQGSALGGLTGHPERRCWPRRPVHLKAQISTETATIDCVVVDLSEGGAQVDLAASISLPELVTLRTRSGGAYPARCRWTRGTRTGLEFTEATPMIGRPSAPRG